MRLAFRSKEKDIKEQRKMTDKDLVEIVAIVDRSESMRKMRDEAISGFNSFLEDQKNADGKANMTLALFNHNYQLVHAGVSIESVRPFDRSTYVPEGTTALLDAVGRTIDDVGNRLANTPEENRPWRVIFCVLTDGEENSSKDYTKDRVKEMVNHQEEKYGWKFIYIAQGLDAWLGASSIGLQHAAHQFDATRVGTQRAYAATSDLMTSFRTEDDDTAK